MRLFFYECTLYNLRVPSHADFFSRQEAENNESVRDTENNKSERERISMCDMRHDPL